MYKLLRWNIKTLRTSRSAFLHLSRKLREKNTDEMVNLSRKILRITDSLTSLENDLVRLREEVKE